MSVSPAIHKKFTSQGLGSSGLRSQHAQGTHRRKSGHQSRPRQVLRNGDPVNQLKLASIALTAAAVFVLSGCSEMSNREDFASLIKNKTEAEVLKLAGKPVQVDQTDPARVTWIYKSRTFDVPTRKTDPETDVIFTKSADDGKLHVAEVLFK
jgi:hypothetical protein